MPLAYRVVALDKRRYIGRVPCRPVIPSGAKDLYLSIPEFIVLYEPTKNPHLSPYLEQQLPHVAKKGCLKTARCVGIISDDPGKTAGRHLSVAPAHLPVSRVP